MYLPLRGNGFPPRITHKNFQFLRGPIRGNDEVGVCGARYAGMTKSVSALGQLCVLIVVKNRINYVF